MFTANEQIAADATDLFNYLTGYSAKRDFQKLLVAPVTMREQIRGPDPRARFSTSRSGERGHLIFKMNALVGSAGHRPAL